MDIIYYVDPRELFCMVTMILLFWEGVKWFGVEAGKTVLVDWTLRTLAGWCKRREAVPADPVEEQVRPPAEEPAPPRVTSSTSGHS